MERPQVKNTWLILVGVVAVTLNHLPAIAKYQVNITGRDAQEVQENAFKKGMNYPVSSMKCSQRCSQWWERE